jgi:hypothetical protein
MEQLTTYRAKGKTIGLVFLFKYDLNGNLKLFEIPEGELTETQQNWLFNQEHFPSNESKMKYWVKNKSFTKIFEVEQSIADLSFDALWNLYDHKHAKFYAIRAFEKMKEEAKIKCFLSIPKYKAYLNISKTGQAHLATYINGRYYENEYK